jgi:hypothetical protein
MTDPYTPTVARSLESAEMIVRALKQIKKSKATWRKYLKVYKDGRVTDVQLEAAKVVLRESVTASLEVMFGAGMHLGQGDECDILDRAEANAADIIA